MPLHSLQSFADLLDELDIAFCLFDSQDVTRGWNRTFLRFFPEHDGKIFAGEHYRQNLRRFYSARLDASELDKVDLYVERGILRHQSQTRPFQFEHRGRVLKVVAQSIPDVGRARLWREVDSGTCYRTDPPQGDHGGWIEELPDGFSIEDAAGRLLQANSRFRGIYGLPAGAEVEGRTLEEIVTAAWRAQASRRHGPGEEAELIREWKRFAGAPYEIALPHGRWVRVIDERAGNGWIKSAHFDITVFKQQQASLIASERTARDREARLHAVIEQSPSGVMIVDRYGRILEANRLLASMLGTSAAILGGDTLFRYLHEDDLQPARRALEAIAAGEQATFEHEGRFRAVDGTFIWALSSMAPLQTPSIEGIAAIVQVQDIRARKRAEAERDQLLARLEYMAFHDALTGLANRARFDEALEDLDALDAPAGGDARAHAICLIDLDGFKQVNDVGGHGAGDALLAEVGRVLLAAEGRHVLPARLGGDEFGLLLGAEAVAEARAIIERILAGIDAVRIGRDGRVFSVKASAGMALFRPGSDVKQVLRDADAACYRAKRNGGGGVVMADPVPAAAQGGLPAR
ncbi:hypothetical protein BKK79_02680 [Cupriavidus sp. USMAA2-4]|uniref:diguanylate cyclase domain-containing protein n=1 Tax=Cupriavidus sp. USMAA2-4 TaxID=876364 RepID=UPI0008A67BDB|nr:diguanylate cyclase [Cupriavidus sp. USMAA2-4]AOY90837.1 hypothetical protein BKK79_02680 [Cupriavidus sp. USMAA2-4]